MANQPGVMPHGTTSHTPTVQHIIAKAMGGGTGTRKRRSTRSSARKSRGLIARGGSGTRRKRRSSSTAGKYNTAAWMAKIRKLRGKGKKAKSG